MSGIFSKGATTDRDAVRLGRTFEKNVFTAGLPAGVSGVGAGQADQGTAAGFFKDIVGGSRSSISAAIAPETSSILSGSDAAKRQASTMGTARGGGTAATNAERGTTTQATVDQAILGARPQAAQALATLGSSEVSGGTGLLGITGSTAGNLAGESANTRQQDISANEGAFSQIAGAIGYVMGL